jgi:four helix bundle protein
MAAGLEDLRVLKSVEAIADAIWKEVVRWDGFARDVVGGQLARAADSVGANIAESFGRFNYGEKLQFLYYSRGSLFEAKYWLNRCLERGLMPADQVKDYSDRLSEVARQLNTFANSLKAQRTSSNSKKQTKMVREPDAEYVAEAEYDDPDAVFTDADLHWLQSIPNP